MNKALVIYGTRYGAAASTAQEIAAVLQREGLAVQIADAKQEKIRSITDFDLVVVGSGIQINRWTGEPEAFLKTYKKELFTKKLALFVCCGSATGKPEDKAKAKAKYLEAKAIKYGLQPIVYGLFGGVYNYNKAPWWAKKALEADRPRVEATYKQVQPGIYDTRDWEAIRNWAKTLAATAKM